MKQHKIVYFSPLKPIKSGISDYSSTLLKKLVNDFEITVVTDGYTPSSETIPDNIKIQDFQKIKDLGEYMKQFDLPIYHMGNNKLHNYIYETLQKFPGITVMHDYAIHHRLADSTLGQGKFDEYMNEINQCGLEITGESRENLSKKFDPLFFLWTKKALQYPMNEKVIASSLGIITHSDFCKNKIIKNKYAPSVSVIPMFIEKSKKIGNNSSNKITIGCFGDVVPNKRLKTIIKAFSKILNNTTTKNTKLIIVGNNSNKEYFKKLKQLINKLKIEQNIEFTGYVSEKKYNSILESTDICINLRYPSVGETSLCLLNILAYSKPCIVTKTGWYAELPDDVVIKISTPQNNNNEKNELKKALESLIVNNEKREEMAKTSYNYIKSNHNLDAISKQYANYINKIINHKELKKKLLTSLSKKMNDIQINPSKHPFLIKGLANTLEETIKS